MYVLTLKHTFGSNLGLAKHNPDKNFKLYPKAINWGNVLWRRVMQTRSRQALCGGRGIVGEQGGFKSLQQGKVLWWPSFSRRK